MSVLLFFHSFLWRSQLYPFYLLSAKQGSNWYLHFYNVFGTTRPGIKQATSRSRSGHSTKGVIEAVNHHTIVKQLSNYVLYYLTTCPETSVISFSLVFTLDEIYHHPRNLVHGLNPPPTNLMWHAQQLSCTNMSVA